eukprot:jgi/Mesvir1/17157/Mv07582-RA.1
MTPPVFMPAAHFLPPVFHLGGDRTDGNASLKNLLGGKGANLAQMAKLGINVPPGFTITTEQCIKYYAAKGTDSEISDELRSAVEDAISWLEKVRGLKFGAAEGMPLFVSVRSGARVSMPGMMDTVLNLGMNDATVDLLASATNNPRFAWDSYRRFVTMYGGVVLGVPHLAFEDALSAAKCRLGKTFDVDLSADDWRQLVAEYKGIIVKAIGRPLPQDPREQLWGAVLAVFSSWFSPRAQTYRQLNHIPEDWGTAVTVQSMVFGNYGDDSGTGVAFTRSPATGEPNIYGEYLLNAQGEDVVAGIRTPQPSAVPLETALPAQFRQLLGYARQLERHFREMQDLEFTIERGTLFMLQCRTAKRTSLASIRVAIDMESEGLISRAEAVGRVDPASLRHLLAPGFDPLEKEAARKDGRLLTKGLNAGPGAATGVLCLSAEAAQARAAQGVPVLLARSETSPEDIAGMAVATGILTQHGGMTSHAAVVARGMGKPCVCGAEEMAIHVGEGVLVVRGAVLREFESWVSIDGMTGEVFAGQLASTPSEITRVLLEQLMAWSAEFKRMKVLANADTPDDARRAVAFGAEGIGLVRTEHMFFGEGRIGAVREMILAEGVEERARAVEKLVPMQRVDFEGILEVMDGRPVTIRLLDPPLHEFLPEDVEGQREMSRLMGVPLEQVRARVGQLREANPMLGHRGVRLGLTHPQIYAAQARAVAEAALAVAARGISAHVEIMVPLVGAPRELEAMRAQLTETIDQASAPGHEIVNYERGAHWCPDIGTMIELPRACVLADKIARHADFFSFGTNDLTQCTYGFSRDDAGSFLPSYLKSKLLPDDPFERLDNEGVGELMRMAIMRGRMANPRLIIGICGEHGGDPASVAFCDSLGLDYVSCSPYRVPIAILASAQAALAAARERERFNSPPL